MNKIEKIDPIGQNGIGNFKLHCISLDILSRIKICESNIITQTKTVANVAIAAMRKKADHDKSNSE